MGAHDILSSLCLGFAHSSKQCLINSFALPFVDYPQPYTCLHCRCVASGGKGAYGAIDAIGGAQSQKIVASLCKNGKYILYGVLDTVLVQVANMDILTKVCMDKFV